MNMDVALRNQRCSEHGGLSHREAVALLYAVTRLLDPAETASEPARSGSPLTSSRMATLVTAMEAVGIDPAVIHAYRQTGILVSEGNEDLWSADEVGRWVAALEDYRGRHGARVVATEH